MSQQFTRHSVIWRPPGGHRTAIRGPPSEILCYVDQTATAGTPHGHRRVTARSSADSRPQIGDCNVIAPVIHAVPMKCAVVCTAFVYKCMFVYKNKLNDIALYYKVLFGVTF